MQSTAAEADAGDSSSVCDTEVMRVMQLFETAGLSADRCDTFMNTLDLLRSSLLWKERLHVWYVSMHSAVVSSACAVSTLRVCEGPLTCIVPPCMAVSGIPLTGTSSGAY